MKLIAFRYLLLVFAVAGFCEGRQNMETVRQARLTTAQRWIKDLGVEHEGSLDSEHADALSQAFDAWIKKDQPPGKPTAVPPVFYSMVPTLWDRTRRLAAVTAERLGTQNYVYVQGSNPLGNPPDFMPNPNHGLYNFTTTITPGEFYISMGDRTALCGAAIEIWGTAGIAKSEALNSKDPKRQLLGCGEGKYLSASRRSDYWGRVALSLNFTVSATQIPRYQSGMILSATDPAAARGWNKTVSGTFDPTLLFRSSTEWQSWVDFYSAHKSTIHDPVLPPQCAQEGEEHATSQACFDYLSKGAVRQRILTSILPKVVVKTYTPFDFVKTGTTFQEPPGGGRALYDVNLSWDLKKVVPSASTRVQALKAYQAFHKPESPPKTDKGDALAAWKTKVKMCYQAIATNPLKVDDGTWWNQFTDLITAQPAQ